MNMKKRMKAFFTLKRRANDGFTLVELIVVIAILAILGGVAVPAYSGYVTKANKQADISLASEISDALQLYYYSNYNGETNGYVVLTPEGVACTFGGSGEAAMDAVFGDGWENTLSLKYDGWMSSAEGAEGSAAITIDAGQLTQSVDMMTDLAAAATQSNNANTVVNVLGLFCGLTDEQKAEMNSYKDEENYSTIATNLMVKYMADDLANMKITEIEGNPVYTDAKGNELSTGSQLAITYAMLYSMANSDDEYKAQAGEVLGNFNNELNALVQKEQEDPSGVSVRNELGKLFTDLQNATVKDNEGNEVSFGEVFMPYYTKNGMTELTGIKTAMDTVGKVTGGYNDVESLSNGDLFTGDAVVNAVQDFQLAATSNGIVVRINNGNCTIVPNLGE